jgi:hypothetical protein
MTGQELTDRLLKRVGENPSTPRFFRQADALAAINEAQQLFVLLTLCLEAETPLALSSGVFEYDASSTAANWLVCLAIRRADGVKVQPSTLGEMAALNPLWQATTAGSAPNRYAVAGFSTLYFTPQITASVTATYARGPVALTLGGSAEIPEEYQPCLLDYAQVRLRLHQGAQLLAADVALLRQFFEAATKCAAYVRTRSLDMRYDVLPPELKLPDFSRVLKAAKKVAPMLDSKPLSE